MNHFGEVKLSSSGRPTFLEGEVECLVQDQISFYNGEKVVHESGILSVTTLRIIYIANHSGICLGLEKIFKLEKKKGGLFLSRSSPKIQVYLSDDSYIKLSFRGGNIDKCLDCINDQIKKKLWLAPKEEVQKGFNTKSAGISGIIKRKEDEVHQTDHSLKQAFKDLDSLMEKAQEMVKLSEKFAEKIRKENNSGSNEEQEFNDVLLDMGLVGSIVTKHTVPASLYHKELAKQLADFLANPLQKCNGMMLLSDAYCLYNRARGIDLVSPEDMYKACTQFDALGLNLTLKEFESGVIIIQQTDKTDEAIGKQISEMIKSNTDNVTAIDIANKLSISILVATEQLLATEKKGLLCRDETLEGVRFFRNFFNDFNVVGGKIIESNVHDPVS